MKVMSSDLRETYFQRPHILKSELTLKMHFNISIHFQKGKQNFPSPFINRFRNFPSKASWSIFVRWRTVEAEKTLIWNPLNKCTIPTHSSAAARRATALSKPKIPDWILPKHQHFQKSFSARCTLAGAPASRWARQRTQQPCNAGCL